MGDIPLEIKDWSQVEQNPLLLPDPDKIDALDGIHARAEKRGRLHRRESHRCCQWRPADFGEPVFDRLDADIAHALMSINAVKGVEIGDGF